MDADQTHTDTDNEEFWSWVEKASEKADFDKDADAPGESSTPASSARHSRAGWRCLHHPMVWTSVVSLAFGALASWGITRFIVHLPPLPPGTHLSHTLEAARRPIPPVEPSSVPGAGRLPASTAMPTPSIATTSHDTVSHVSGNKTTTPLTKAQVKVALSRIRRAVSNHPHASRTALRQTATEATVTPAESGIIALSSWQATGYQVRAVSASQAILAQYGTGRLITVKPGDALPGCGTVAELDPARHRIETDCGWLSRPQKTHPKEGAH